MSLQEDFYIPKTGVTSALNLIVIVYPSSTILFSFSDFPL